MDFVRSNFLQNRDFSMTHYLKLDSLKRWGKICENGGDFFHTQGSDQFKNQKNINLVILANR